MRAPRRLQHDARRIGSRPTRRDIAEAERYWRLLTAPDLKRRCPEPPYKSGPGTWSSSLAWQQDKQMISKKCAYCGITFRPVKPIYRYCPKCYFNGRRRFYAIRSCRSVSGRAMSASWCNADLAAQINAEHGTTLFGKAREALEHARRAGELLLQAKGSLGHGEWLPWIEANCKFSSRTAQGYMRLASRWESLRDKSATVSHLELPDALT
jgi:hypothetical protein